MVFSVIVLIISVMFHELAHGIVADRMGDPTPSLAGRLTLNPLAHMEWVGSFLVPLLCVISGTGFIIGWAKPVPFNPRYFSHKRWGPAWVAAAGPITNIILVIIFAAVFRSIAGNPAWAGFAQIAALVVVINISLAVFNLMPLPPLDGHHILGAIIPVYREWADRLMGTYGIMVTLLAIFLAGSIIAPIVSFFIRLLLQ